MVVKIAGLSTYTWQVKELLRHSIDYLHSFECQNLTIYFNAQFPIDRTASEQGITTSHSHTFLWIASRMLIVKFTLHSLIMRVMFCGFGVIGINNNTLIWPNCVSVTQCETTECFQTVFSSTKVFRTGNQIFKYHKFGQHRQRDI